MFGQSVGQRDAARNAVFTIPTGQEQIGCGKHRHGDARRQAVKEAVTRAREYAAALGSDLASLLELADPGIENAHPAAMPAPGGGYGRRAFSAAAAEDTAAPALDLEPQRQTVYAQVTARFTMTPPKL